jgi:hypothetical protein
VVEGRVVSVGEVKSVELEIVEVEIEAVPAWNNSKRFSPPQFSDVSPLQAILQPADPSDAVAPPFLISESQ